MITPQAWKEILKIFFMVRRSVENVFAGEYKSIFKGHGLEFNEVREYVPGDDVRNIDWKVTARYGHPFVKKYIEERELTIMILLDLSRSLEFGTVKSKKEVAAEITALISWAAIANNDRIGMLIFSDKVEKYVRPRKGKHQILKLIREVLTYPVTGAGTDIKGALEYMYKMIKKRAVIFVISDFYSADYLKPLKILAQKHDIVPITISDPWEEGIDLKTEAYLEDEETGEIYYISEDRKLKIKEKLAEIKGKRQGVFREAGIDHLDLRTDRNYLNDLFAYFNRRFGRR
ncbi:MAG: DUF58 domain-containing protein [Elusimicrobia bacterium]|nr:DUF58 domain-containing protein [Elusimicrobiota bacterium]